MKKIALGLIVLSTLLLSNELEKQIPEIFHKMIDQFEQKNSQLDENNMKLIISNYENKKLVFCETKSQRSIITKKNNWVLDKKNNIFLNLEKEKYFYINECKVFKEADKIYL